MPETTKQSREFEIDRLSGGRGFACLTQAEKDRVNAIAEAPPVTPTVRRSQLRTKTDTQTAPEIGQPQRVSRIQARQPSPLQQKESKLLEGIADVGEAPERETILGRERAEAQAIADRITQQFNEIIAGETVAGEERAARVRALNIGAGLAGGDFASAAAERDAAKTRAIIETRKQERNVKINEVLSGVESRADEKFQKAREDFLAGAEGAIESIQAFQDRQKSSASASIAELAASGATFEELQGNANFGTILEAFDGNEAAVKGTFLNSIPEKDKLGTTTVGNKFLTFYVDPITGERSTLEFEIPQDIREDQTVERIFTNGQVALKTTKVDEGGNTVESIEIVTPKGAEKVTRTTDTDTSDRDIFSAEDERQLNQSGLKESDTRVQSIFVNTPSSFRQFFTQQGKGKSTTTATELLNDLENWELQQAGGGGNPFAQPQQ